MKFLRGYSLVSGSLKTTKGVEFQQKLLQNLPLKTFTCILLRVLIIQDTNLASYNFAKDLACVVFT